MNNLTIASLTLSGLFLTQSSQLQPTEAVPPHAAHEFSYPANTYTLNHKVVVELVPDSTISETIHADTPTSQSTIQREASTAATTWEFFNSNYYASYRDDETTAVLPYDKKLNEYKTGLWLSFEERTQHSRLMDLMNSIAAATAEVRFHSPQILCVKDAGKMEFNCTKFERK